MVWIWLAFILFILILLALDLGVFHRTAHVVSMREALGWSAVWISLGLAFTVFVWFGYENHWMGLGNEVDAIDGAINDGSSASVKYVTGYLIEKSLSVDNIFVIAMLFAFFAVPAIQQHRVLFWGILGALVMRGVMIFIGAELIYRYNWVLYVFGAFLLLTAVKMLLLDSGHSDPAKNPVIRLTRRLFPVSDKYHGGKFIAMENGRRVLTPLAMALIMVETTDLVFAVDSIPAIFAITTDRFLVFTSNVFAILGLRSLYFALAGLMHKFRYLKVSLAVVLMVVGIKMLAAKPIKQLFGEHYHFYLLGLVLLILAVGVVASLLAPAKPAARPIEAESGH